MKRLLDAYDRLLRLAITALMGAILVPVGLQIFSRYVGFIPRYIWTEEVARFCFIWIIMIGSMIAVRDATHFDVDVLPKPRTARGRAIARLVVDGFMLVMALVFVRYGYDFAAFGWEQNSELTGINMISIHLAFPLAGVTWVLFLGERIVAAVATLRERRP
ncbi:MAG: TRAP transporter permease DctM/Q [Candidatus Rokuibacteriota bacterium]|nr:MAG: TRAP transporter [Candidatus Rokubacteria bacterium 13_2_20CM_2_70_11]PYN31720.1 MAG: TRAP transporter permease DctM/Q [Candidatus Rokubacteria bacterium]